MLASYRCGSTQSWRTAPIWRRLALCLLPLCVLMLPPRVSATDVPAPIQAVGHHSTVTASDGEIRDKELVDHICQQINVNGGKVKDVKLMVQSCYGGGLLDDMARAFGPGGACAGIPWVAGAASAPDKTASGWKDEIVNKDTFKNDKLGGGWTDALAGNSPFNMGGKTGVITNGSASNNVMQDLQAAGNKDALGPQGKKLEVPVVASGNGGDQIMWKTDGAKHEAVVFAGKPTDQGQHNNVENVANALEMTWSEGIDNRHIQKLDGGKKHELFDAIALAATRLDENTQLVIYIDDHGGSSYDMSELFATFVNKQLQDPVSGTVITPDGIFDGLFGNFFYRSGPPPMPVLRGHINQCTGCANWQFMVNHHSLPLPPGGNQTGPLELPVDFRHLQPGGNLIEIIPQGSSNIQASGGKPQFHLGSMTLSSLELSTGPINELDGDQVLVPAQSAAYFDPERSGEGIFVELLADSRALVYVFSYGHDSPTQSWMLGVGQQVSEGILVHEMLLPTGPSFGPDFDPDDAVYTDFGSLFFRFPTCRNSAQRGSLFVYPEAATNFENLQTENYIQLSVLVDCASGVGSANTPLSGSWFDPSHEGEGIILEVLEDGTAVVQWFTYDQGGEQMWIQGTGSFNGDTLEVNDLFTTGGTQWGSGFDPDEVSTPPWGSLTLEFTGCGEAELNYQSTAGFGNGTLNMVRLTNLMGITCT